MHMQNVWLDASDQAPDGQHLGQEERRHLKPAALAAPQILQNRAVSQVLPAPWKEPEPPDIQRAVDLIAYRPGH